MGFSKLFTFVKNGSLVNFIARKKTKSTSRWEVFGYYDERLLGTVVRSGEQWIGTAINGHNYVATTLEKVVTLMAYEEDPNEDAADASPRHIAAAVAD